MMGASYDFNFSGDKGKLSASYVDFDGSLGISFNLTRAPGQQSGVTRQNVYGLDLAYDLGGMMLEAGGGKSTALGIAALTAVAQNGKTGSDIQNLDTLIDKNNSRWNVSLGSKTDSHSFKVGYKNVEGNYIAPGDWGRVSVYRNLTDTRALTFSAGVMLSKKLDLHGMYEKGDAIAGIGGYKSYRAGVSTDLTPKWGAELSYENTMFTGGFHGLNNDAVSKFTTLRLGYDMGSMRSLNIFWQRTEADDIFPITRGFPSGPIQGSMYGFQYSIKF
jgi:hypothetical protein